jgi:hypothetical protein
MRTTDDFSTTGSMKNPDFSTTRARFVANGKNIAVTPESFSSTKRDDNTKSLIQRKRRENSYHEAQTTMINTSGTFFGNKTREPFGHTISEFYLTNLDPKVSSRIIQKGSERNSNMHPDQLSDRPLVYNGMANEEILQTLKKANYKRFLDSLSSGVRVFFDGRREFVKLFDDFDASNFCFDEVS